jgi:hypothetical protein
VILSFHIADLRASAALGVLRRRPRPGKVPGLRYAETAIPAALDAEPFPPPRPTGAALIASWEDDDACERFLSSGHPVAEALADGWRVRLQPLRVFGGWSALEGLPEKEIPADPDEPVAVMTIGRLRFRRARPFFRANSPAGRQAVNDEAMIRGTGMARPPGFLATFSIWRSAAEMRAYATGRSDRSHLNASLAHREHPFHHEAAFMRFRPYGAEGSWDGVEPLAAAQGVGGPSPAIA